MTKNEKRNSLNILIENSNKSQLDLKNTTKKLDKRELKKCKKMADEKLQRMKTNNFLIPVSNIIKNDDFSIALSFILETNDFGFIGPMNKIQLDFSYLLKDKKFEIELKKQLTVIAHSFNNFIKRTPYNIVNLNKISENLNDFIDEKITSFIIHYFILNSNNSNNFDNKIKNLLSFFLKHYKGIILIENETTQQKKYIEEMTSGISVEKLKNQNPTNNLNYNKSNNVDVVNYLKNQIRVKYISGFNGKHTNHKSPITHERKEHQRVLKNGKTILVKSSVINPNYKLNVEVA